MICMVFSCCLQLSLHSNVVRGQSFDLLFLVKILPCSMYLHAFSSLGVVMHVPNEFHTCFQGIFALSLLSHDASLVGFASPTRAFVLISVM